MEEWIYSHADNLLALVFGSLFTLVGLRFRQSQQIAKLEILIERNILPQLTELRETLADAQKLINALSQRDSAPLVIGQYCSLLEQLTSALTNTMTIMSRLQKAGSSHKADAPALTPPIPVIGVRAQRQSKRKDKPVRTRKGSAE